MFLKSCSGNTGLEIHSRHSRHSKFLPQETLITISVVHTTGNSRNHETEGLTSHEQTDTSEVGGWKNRISPSKKCVI